jgi:Flp pilus assembly protein TadG
MRTVHLHRRRDKAPALARVLKLFRADAGMSTVEFALLVPIFSTMLVGVLDLGMGFWNQIQVGNAARAGAEYALTNGFDSTKVSSAITHATNLSSISASPAPSQSCGCPDASKGVLLAACGTPCTGGGNAGTYVIVNAQASYGTIFSYPGIPNPMTLGSVAVVRIK